MEQTRVLVVEDDPTTGMVIKAQLSKLGYAVAPVLASGEAAIEWVEKHRPDAVVMDIELKGARIQGTEAANIIYERFYTPVIFLSARADDEAFELIRGSHSYGFVAKPPRQRELELSLELALDKHRLEQELRDSGARLSAILQTSLDSIITIDSAGAIVEFNTAAEETFGYRRDDVLGRQMADLIIPEPMRAEHLKGIQRLYDSPQQPLIGKRMEFIAQRADGSRFPLEIAVSSFTVNEERYFTAFARDITVRREAEQKLRLRDRLLHGVARATDTLLTGEDLNQALQEALQTLGTSVVTDRVYISRNVTGYSEEGTRISMELLHEWLSPEGQARLHQVEYPRIQPYMPNYARWYENLAVGEPIGSLTSRLPLPERQELEKMGVVSILLAPVMLDGSYWGFIGFEDYLQEREWSNNERNIILAMAGSIGGAIARKQSEEALRRSQDELSAKVQELKSSRDELAQATALLVQKEKLATLGTIAGSVAHEINSPLGAILNCAERLNSSDLSTESYKRNVNLILNAAIRCRNVIVKFLDSSVRPSTDEAFCSIQRTLEDWFELYGKQMEYYDISWHVDMQEDFLMGLSETECMQVITNLILNARDALADSGMDEQGHIEIRAYKEDVNGVLEVIDNGPGFPVDLLPTIFEPFVSTKEKGKGTGLGLYITQKIVTDAGGKLELTNCDQGAKVMVTIPLVLDSRPHLLK